MVVNRCGRSCLVSTLVAKRWEGETRAGGLERTHSSPWAYCRARICRSGFIPRGSHSEEGAHFSGRIQERILNMVVATDANDSVENYADLFTTVLRNDDIQEFDSK